MDYQFLLEKAWLLLVGWFWYDKRQVNMRLLALEKTVSESSTKIELLEANLLSIKELLEVKLESVKQDTQEIRHRLNSRRSGEDQEVP